MPISMSNAEHSPDNAGKIPRLLAKLGLIADLKRIAVILVACLALGLNANAFVGNNGRHPEAVPNRHRESALRIDVRSAHDLSSKGKALLVDVRSANSYRKEHAAGAINLPNQILVVKEKCADFVAKVPKDTHLIVYCSSAGCGQAADGVMYLNTLGYTNVSAMRGGLNAWKRAGLLTEKGEQTAPAAEEKK